MTLKLSQPINSNHLTHGFRLRSKIVNYAGHIGPRRSTVMLKRWVVVRTDGGYVMALTERECELHKTVITKVLWKGVATDYRTAVDAYNGGLQ